MVWTIIILCVVIVLLGVVCFILFNKNDFQKNKELKKEVKKKNEQIKEQSVRIAEQHASIGNTFEQIESRLLADKGVKNEAIPSIVSDIKRSISYD